MLENVKYSLESKLEFYFPPDKFFDLFSGVAFIFNQKFFNDLNQALGIDLENIVYYKGKPPHLSMNHLLEPLENMICL